jgi:hypothetical protein
MELQLHQSKSGRCLRCAALVLLIILFLQSAAAASGNPTNPSPLATHTRPAAVLLVAEGWSIRRTFGKVETFLSDRRRMIQLATVGMLIGLFILLRK